MKTFSEAHQEERTEPGLPEQALCLFFHALVACAAWAALMLLGYIIHPAGVPQSLILLCSILFPLAAGFVANKFRQDELATLVWLLGLIWILIVALWVLDMPTGPAACLQCDATEKLTRTFFSFTTPSGLIDDDGPFLGTWPAAALCGYALGAKLALRKQQSPRD
jgi:hypothetical protein